MTQGQFDLVDIFAYMIFFICGIYHLSLVPMDGGPLVFIAEPLFSFTSDGWTNDITIAMVGSILSLIAVAVTNDINMDALGGLQVLLLAATAWLILSPPFIPIMSELLTVPIAAVIALIVQTGGFMALGYLG